jgi:predicted acylesterase/phospholipase RssA
MIRPRFVLAAGLLAAALLPAAGTSPASAQEAIVLSGGAARALAHAGVLQGLERRGHDPEIVTGASMGAVIGSLYAAGFSPDSIATLITQQDWHELFAPMPVPFGGARELRHPVLRFQMSGAEGFGMRGFISDWRANRELVRLLFAPGARTRGHFDRLPRRFRAVATDLATGEPVVLGRGDLARAVRASVAQPGFLAPVRWQGRVLVDGGVGDDLPIEPARRMGARTVIASDVIRPRALPKNIRGFAATARSLDFMTVHGRPPSPPPAVLLLPDVDPTASPIVYPTDPTPFLRAGLDAVMHSDLPDAPRSAKARSAAPLPDRFGGLTVEAANPAIEAFVRRGLASSAKGAFNPSRVLARVDRLYATGLFDGIWVSVEDSVAEGLAGNGTDDDAPTLIARTDSRPGLTFLGAAGYDNDRGGRAWLALNHELALPGHPLQASLEGSADGIVKSAAFALHLPTLLGPSLAWTAGAEISETHVRSSSDVRRTEGWFGVEARTIAPGVHAALTMRSERVRTDVGPAGTSSGPQLRLGTVTPLVQAVGIPTLLEIEGRFGDFDYGRVRLQVSRSFGGMRTAIAPLAVLIGASTEAPVDRHPALGDDHLIPALTWGEHRGKVLGVFGIDVSQVIPRRATLVLRARAGRTDRQESFDPNPEKSRWIFGAGLSNLWWLPLGRIEAGFEAGTLGDRRATIRLGADF